MDTVSRAARSRIMSRIRSEWTAPEVEWALAHPGASRGDFLPFRPDFLLRGRAVFIDGDFWHCAIPERRYMRLPAFWRRKLFRNLVRDASRDAFYSALAAHRR